MKRGYCGIGIEMPKFELNVGGLWRAASVYGADFIFTISDRRYTHQASDTPKTSRHKPMLWWTSAAQFKNCVPEEATVVGVEMHQNATPLSEFVHPERAVYLLGNEATGLSDEALQVCDKIVCIESPVELSLNVAVAGACVMWHRYVTKPDQKARGGEVNG